MYDVVIVGAGPAGATAAALLAGDERGILLVDRATLPHPPGQAVWINAAANPILETIGAKIDDTGARPIAEITFYNDDLSKTATPAFEQPPALVAPRGTFNDVLIQAAKDAGAEVRGSWPVAKIDLAEEFVELTGPDGENVRGRMLLAAMGGEGTLAQPMAKARQAPSSLQWTAQFLIDAPPAAADPAVWVVLGLDKQGSFGLVISSGGQLSISACGHGPGDAGPGLLISLCQALVGQELAPAEAVQQAARATIQRCPAGAALEMDSHVAKHALIVGEAGGFVSATSQESIYPGMWSAQLAVEILENALKSTHSQDVLMEYDPKWRMAMAEYLRPPNTDIQFLLPLIFANQPMADRMGAAFFLGESI
ncbi:MAG: hypothetical protein GY778_30995 [bacterium]|nr:hypothetical protein [bacterium]